MFLLFRKDVIVFMLSNCSAPDRSSISVKAKLHSDHDSSNSILKPEVGYVSFK